MARHARFPAIAATASRARTVSASSARSTDQSAPAPASATPTSSTSATFGADDSLLLTYAMNDLRNNAAAHGADYVHRSEPTLAGVATGKVTTAAYAGVAYRCRRTS